MFAKCYPVDDLNLGTGRVDRGWSYIVGAGAPPEESAIQRLSGTLPFPQVCASSEPWSTKLTPDLEADQDGKPEVSISDEREEDEAHTTQLKNARRRRISAVVDVRLPRTSRTRLLPSRLVSLVPLSFSFRWTIVAAAVQAAAPACRPVSYDDLQDDRGAISPGQKR